MEHKQPQSAVEERIELHDKGEHWSDAVIHHISSIHEAVSIRLQNLNKGLLRDIHGSD